MSRINNKDLYELVLSGSLTPERAIEKSKQLRLDHFELAILCDIDLPEAKPRDEAEAEQPKTWRVQARGVPGSDGRGVPFKSIWAGRHAWTRDPKTSSQHELTDTQMRDLQKKADKGGIIILKRERLKQEQPAEETKQADTKAEHSGGGNRRR